MAGLGLVILILLAAGWQYVGSYYNRFIALTARPFLASWVTVTAQGTELQLNYSRLQTSRTELLGIRSLTLYYGALLATALIVVTLVCSWRRRVLSIGFAWMGFTAVAIFTVVVMSWGLNWTMEGGPANLNSMGPVMTLSYIGIPALVCAGWCIKYWFPVIRLTTISASIIKRR